MELPELTRVTRLRCGTAAARANVASSDQYRTAAQAPRGFVTAMAGPPTSSAVSAHSGMLEASTSPQTTRTQAAP